MTRRTLSVALLTLTLFASVAEASWYDDYDAGVAAAKKGRWSDVVAKMSAAIKGNAKEGNNVRTYGMITTNYHPYYYRGVAYMQTGRYDEAIADFERTSGPGPLDLGSLDVLMDRVKKQQAAASDPDPEPARPEPVRTEPVRPAVTTPPVTTPAVPQIDPALRQRASAAIAEAKQKVTAAQQRRATGSAQYSDAMRTLTEAVSKNSVARTNDDLNSVIQLAGSASDFADLATAPVAAAPTLATTTPTPLNPPPVIPRPSAATAAVIDEHADEVRDALELYFAGEFEDAAAGFERLTQKMPNNGWIHAFLGASLYSRYAFEAEDVYRRRALDSFRKAKQLRSWGKNGLPEKYFSKRIRKVFSETAG
ncbi:MAG TPA: tetratricopeptide repeat protein [Thermoanaerobaculia bacterium]|nr:tetratricopeptide repeat protein [Thermoanaerobaculia bacterium]